MVLLRSGMHVAELDVIADVAVVDVGRIVRIEGLGRLPSNGARWRRLPRREVLKTDIGRNVDHHGRVAERP